MSRKTCPAARAERGSGELHPAVGGAQRPLDREHEERHRDEGLREHDGAGRVR